MTKAVRTAGDQSADGQHARWKTVEGIRKKARPARARSRRDTPKPLGSLLSGLFGVLWIVLGLTLTVLCGGVWYASGKFVEIIDEINQRNFSQMTVREKKYEEIFDSMRLQGFKVERDANRNFQGVITYMWRVQPPSSLETREFSWDYILEDTKIVPRTNGAAMLDISLGYITEGQAEELDLASGVYNAQDRIDRAIVYLDIGLKPLSDWGSDTAEGGVLAPLIPPAEGLARQRGFEDELIEEDEEAGREEVSDDDSLSSGSEAINISSD